MSTLKLRKVGDVSVPEMYKVAKRLDACVDRGSLHLRGKATVKSCNLTHFEQTDAPYEIQTPINIMFEPYSIVRFSPYLPRYDERFGMGGDKLTYVWKQLDQEENRKKDRERKSGKEKVGRRKWEGEREGN